MTGADKPVFRPLPEAGDVLEQQPELREDDAPKGFTDYEDRYVLFIDILGFTELIHQSAQQNPPLHGSVSAIFQALDRPFDGEAPGGVANDFLETLDLTSPGTRFSRFTPFPTSSWPPARRRRWGWP